MIPDSGDAIPFDLTLMEARLTEELPSIPGWQFEPKWDGFRCLAFKIGNRVELRAKSGKSLTRFFPDVAASIGLAELSSFVVDGELAIPEGPVLSFDALQARLHPSDRHVRVLAARQPAVLILFDCLMDIDGRNLLRAAFSERRKALERLVEASEDAAALRLTPYTRSAATARRWLARVGGALDGVVAKRLDAPYLPGERAMLKIKRLRTADCVVGGFRHREGTNEVASLLLGLYDEAGKLNHVGFTAAIADKERAEITACLSGRIEPPGFTGSAPGGPSRWNREGKRDWFPVRPGLVVEVRYDHVTGNRFRHGTQLLRWRPDKAPSQCTLEQLGAPERPSALLRRIVSTSAARPRT